MRRPTTGGRVMGSYIVAKLPVRLVRIIDRLPALRLRVRRITTRAARPIAALALAPAVALLAVLGGLLMSSGAANVDPSCEVPPSGLAGALNDAGSGIVLTWDASSCTPDEYALYRRNMDEDGSRMRLFATVDGATLTYADTSVEAGVTSWDRTGRPEVLGDSVRTTSRKHCASLRHRDLWR